MGVQRTLCDKTLLSKSMPKSLRYENYPLCRHSGPVNVMTLSIVTRRPGAQKAHSQRRVRGGATDLPMTMALDTSRLEY